MKLTGTADNQTFCIYCQKQYASPVNLARHIVRKHKFTHAYWNVVLPTPKESG